MSNLLKYIDHLQKKNALDLAFYPLTSLEKAIEANHVITCKENDEVAGYLWYGSARSGFDITVYQACVDYSARRRHLGWSMVKELIDIGKAVNSLGIRLRCASSSEANEFWKLIGFYCTRVSDGGLKRSRKINHWRTDLVQPLFTLPAEDPSVKKIDERGYTKKAKTMPTGDRFSRNHY